MFVKSKSLQTSLTISFAGKKCRALASFGDMEHKVFLRKFLSFRLLYTLNCRHINKFTFAFLPLKISQFCFNCANTTGTDVHLHFKQKLM